MDADSVATDNQDFIFIGNDAFSGAAGELRYELGSDGNTHIFGDVNSDSVADFEIILTGNIPLADTDFTL